VGDEENGLPGLAQKLLEVSVEPLAGECVQGAEGLVAQEHAGVEGEGPGQSHALLHAARELVDQGALEPAEVDLGEELPDHRVEVVPSHPPLPEAEGDVVEDVEPGEEGRLLEDHDPIGAGADDPGAVQGDLARAGGDEPRDQVEKGRLATAGRANQGDELAFLCGE